MMKNPTFSYNTIFIFLMTRNMTLNLFNIASNCIGNTWWIMNMNHNGIGCGVMVMQCNLRVANHGFFVSRHPCMIGGYKMLWNFFGSGDGKGPHDG
jgi:hypothetical protein